MVQFSKQPPIPGYEPIRVLGINHGTLYLARHTSGVLVALNVLPLDLAEQYRDRFAALAHLQHPNIVRLLGMGEFEGQFFYALEYFEKSLADRLLERPFSDVEVAQLADTVCSALQYAGDQGMIPVSLEPNSILLTDDNVPKLSQFCSHETFEKLPKLLFPALMVPEWVSLGAGSVSEASQVYRVGVLVYEMLTARLPFEAEHPEAARYLVLHATPEPPRRVNRKVGRELEAICMKCLVKPPEDRYASLQELIDHLRQFAQSREGSH